MLRTDIGEGDDALLCTTDSTTCCSNIPPEIRAGEIFFPNGSRVPIMIPAVGGYYRNRGSQLIRLNRRSSGTTIGQFRCTIPNASGTTMDLFIYISMLTSAHYFIIIIVYRHYYFHFAVDNLPVISVLINSFGTNVAGETYSLECSAPRSELNDQITITWLDSRNIKVPSGMISVNGGVTVLRFNPLISSHAGTYTCKATLESAVTFESINVTVESKFIV